MKKVIFKKTEKMPEVKIDGGTLFITGPGVGNKNVEWFKVLLKKHIPNFVEENKKIILNVNLEYFSTSFSSGLLDFFKYFAALDKRTFKVNVIWNYEENDEDMLEAGQDYQEIIDLPFEIVVLKA